MDTTEVKTENLKQQTDISKPFDIVSVAGVPVPDVQVQLPAAVHRRLRLLPRNLERPGRLCAGRHGDRQRGRQGDSLQVHGHIFSTRKVPPLSIFT